MTTPTSASDTAKRPYDLTDEDFLRTEMDHLDGQEWQDAQDLRDECYRGRVHNSLTARIRVAMAINARQEARSV